MMGYPHASVLVLPQIFVCLLWLAASSTSASAEPVSNSLQVGSSSSIQITLSKQADTAIRLEARSAPLGQVLKAIADKTGAQIHYSVLPEAPVTATCVAANVGQVMDCLVAKQVGLVAHKPQKDKPAEFWLLGSSVGSCQAVTVAANASSDQKLVEQQPTPEQQAQMEQMLQEQTDQLLKQAQSTDTNQRYMAIMNLSSLGQDDPAVNEVLHTAMNDKDTNIRIQAITALAQRGGADVDAQLSQAIKDKDVNVRVTAVSAIQGDIPLLQQALNDSDKSVRDLAKSKLDDLSKIQN